MPSKHTLLLITLLFIFFPLYILNPIIFSKTYGDLWANLLAGIITVLIIDRIVERSNKEKHKISTLYVKKKLALICFALAVNLAPIMRNLEHGFMELEWRNAIKKGYNPKQWGEYYERIKRTREKSLDDIKYISENHLSLIDDALQDDVFKIRMLLEKWEWSWLSNEIRTDIWKLHTIAEISSITLIESVRVLEENNLLEYSNFSNRYYFNEKNELSSKLVGNKWQTKTDRERLKFYEKESIDFVLTVKAEALTHDINSVED